ncbi:hypothetical protein RLI68_00965, partial [Streptococcus pneumoniae]|nr:hypothetical protein [Streptococcus pneumoniae]
NFIFITQFHNKTPQKLDFFCLTFGVQFNGGVVLFVVWLSENNDLREIYYKSLPPLSIKKLLKKVD